MEGSGPSQPVGSPQEGGPPPVSCCMLQERKRQRPGQPGGLHSNQSHCLCLLSVWEKRQVSTPKTTMSSPNPPQTQALDQQRSTKATFHIQSGKSAHLSQTQHHQGCMGALGHELAVPITITRNADKAISTLPSNYSSAHGSRAFGYRLVSSSRAFHRLWFPEHSEKLIPSLSKCKAKVGPWIQGRMRPSRGGESHHLAGAR